jgi:hypothetical protein
VTRRISAFAFAVFVGSVAAIVQGVLSPPVMAHGGGLDSNGCHNDRQRGGYHCHRGPLAGQSFGSATEARAALSKPATPPPTATPAQRTASQQLAAIPTSKTSAIPGAFCGLDRKMFELLVSLRMQNYESSGDSWSPRAVRWRNEISGNLAAGRTTSALDATFTRYARYCAEGDSFMAGIAVGEWVGIGLRTP